jgi:hypothetical protein
VCGGTWTRGGELHLDVLFVLFVWVCRGAMLLVPCVCRYDKPALRMAGGAPAASRRPTVGDRVVLTADYASHSDAAGGM